MEKVYKWNIWIIWSRKRKRIQMKYMNHMIPKWKKNKNEIYESYDLDLEKVYKWNISIIWSLNGESIQMKYMNHMKLMYETKYMKLMITYDLMP